MNHRQTHQEGNIMLTDEHLNQITALQNKYTRDLLRKRHVVGVSIGPIPEDSAGPGGWGLIVLVDRIVDPAEVSPEDRIPSQIEGVPVIVREIGRVKAF
jgi:hypothetical protein